MLGQPFLPGAAQILLAMLVATAAIFDLRCRRIPNWLVLAGIVVGLGWNAHSSGFSGMGRAATGLGLVFALYLPFYLIRALGAGDVKLLAAIGAITVPAIVSGFCCDRHTRRCNRYPGVGDSRAPA